jgi:hypothetical protein
MTVVSVSVVFWVLPGRAHSQSIISGSFGLFLDGLSCSTRAGGSHTSGTPRLGFSLIAVCYYPCPSFRRGDDLCSSFGTFAVLRVAHLAQQ